MVRLLSSFITYHNPLPPPPLIRRRDRFSVYSYKHYYYYMKTAAIGKTPALGRRCLINFRCLEQQQQPPPEQKDDKSEFQRLFSNLNPATLQREPGSVTSSVLLVAGTTVVTGLLIAEVNVKTMCELGSGGVSLVSMATRTLGTIGVQIACWSYIFIHYALLVAYVARSSDILTGILGIPVWECASLFSLLFGSLCYFGSRLLVQSMEF